MGFSHGHNDHTWGLGELVKLYSEAKSEGDECKTPIEIAHPDAFLDKNEDGLDIGSIFHLSTIKAMSLS